MGFFSKISKKGQDVADRAKDAIEIVKLNTNINDEEKKKRAVFTEIGEKYVESLDTDNNYSFDEQIKNINESDEKIKDYQRQIAKIKGMVYCTQCGEAVHDDAIFCCKCGAKMNNNVQDTTSNGDEEIKEVPKEELIKNAVNEIVKANNEEDVIIIDAPLQEVTDNSLQEVPNEELSVEELVAEEPIEESVEEFVAEEPIEESVELVEESMIIGTNASESEYGKINNQDDSEIDIQV